MKSLLSVVLVAGWFCAASVAAESALWQQFKQAKLNDTEPTLPDFSYAGYDYSESPLPDTSGWAVFNVTAYGAVADDGNYDDAAIQATIDAAEAAGGGIVFFPPGRFMVSPNNDITETIKVQGSNLLLKGSGSGAGGTEIFMDEMKVNNGRYMFEVLPTSTAETTLTTVVADAPRESYEIEVADASALSVGQRIVLRATSVPYATAYYAPLALDPAWTRLTSTEGFNINEIHTVAAIDGNTVTFREPLHLPMITSGITIQVRSYNVITDVGVEDILFKGSWNTYPETFVHHKDDIHDYAWNALRFDNVANGWLRNCEFKDWNQGVYFDGCASFTVDGISFTGKKGHMSIHVRRSYGVLVKDCVDAAAHYHGPGIGYWGCGTVYLRHQMAGNQTIDSHSGSPYATLMDQVTGGNFDGNGGPYESYPHHGKHFVAWNFNVSGGPNSYNFWPNSRNAHTFATPIFAGLQGKSISMSGQGVNESSGAAVEPASLFEAQLQFRLGPTVETAPASSIGSGGATLNGSLVSTGDAPSSVRIYWGTSDAGKDENAWEQVEDLGSSVVGPLSVPVTGLVAGQMYHYRVWASNAYYDAWSAESASFTIPGPPSVIATGATDTFGTQATLNGALGGGNPADITVVWDTADRGSYTVEDWPAANAIVISNQPDGNFGVTATGLVPGQPYTYRIFASNAEGEAWSGPNNFVVLADSSGYDFNSDATNGTNPSGWFDASTFSGSVAVLDVVTDTNNIFGQGTSNKVARYTETNTGDNGLAYFNFTPSAGDFFTITFDYYMADNGSTYTNGVDTALGNGDLNNSTRRYASHTGPIALNSLVSASILVNESGTAKDYINPVTGSTESLASGASISFDFHHGTGSVSNRTSGSIGLAYGDVDKFGFKTSNSDTAQFLFDDVVRHDQQLFVVGPEAGPAISSFTAVAPGIWEVTLKAAPNTTYEFRSTTTLDFTPGQLVENLTQGSPGTDPGTIGGTNDSMVTTDSSGMASVRMVLTGNPADFVRAQNLP